MYSNHYHYNDNDGDDNNHQWINQTSDEKQDSHERDSIQLWFVIAENSYTTAESTGTAETCLVRLIFWKQ